MKFKRVVRVRRRIPAVRQIIININGVPVMNVKADMGVILTKIGSKDFRFSNGVLEMDLRGLRYFV